MTDDQLEKFFEICRRVYEQKLQDGSWPWESDSPKPEDLIESNDTTDSI